MSFFDWTEEARVDLLIARRVGGCHIIKTIAASLTIRSYFLYDLLFIL